VDPDPDPGRPWLQKAERKKLCFELDVLSRGLEPGGLSCSFEVLRAGQARHFLIKICLKNICKFEPKKFIQIKIQEKA
jgi:hypothetical protein